MGATIRYKGNSDLWVSNSVVDYFSELIAEVSKMNGNNISLAFEDDPNIAGCYGVSGLGIDLEVFFKYFGGKSSFIQHLLTCRENLSSLCTNPKISNNMYHVFSWAVHILNGGQIKEGTSIYESLPCGI